MSLFSRWSYTAKVTFWAPTLDEYSQPSSWTRAVFAATWANGGRLAVDSAGEEFTPDLVVHLEASASDAPKVGWKMLVGEDASAEPPANARAVRRVRSFDPSTFSEGLPDFEVMA